MTLKVKEVLSPGIWIDTDGYPHISIPDVLDYFGWPHDQRHKKLVQGVAEELIARIGKQPVRVERCPNCGCGDGEEHSALCALALKGK